jgi:chemotaxis response regulator CheB
MCVRVLVADDSAVMRRAIKRFLESEFEISLVGEAESTDELIAKSNELHPDAIVLDVRMTETRIALTPLKSALSGARLIAITFGADDATQALADKIHPDQLIDKMDLTEKLIPALLGTLPNHPV